MRGPRHRSPLLLLALATATSACTKKAATPQEQTEGSDPVPLQGSDSQLPKRGLPARAEDGIEAPLQLTASDGTGLKLVSLKARGVVQEPVAFTQLHLTFENPEARTIEGRFTIDLPPGAAISRFAMKIGGRWQEGEVVERQAARVAYEDFLHRRQDPALLENQAGNRFSARVFPIPANGRKQIIVSYSQELSDSREPYRLMLRGLPELETLDAEVIIDRVTEAGGSATSVGGEAATRKVIRVQKSSYTPDKDLEVSSASPHEATGIRHANLALARVQAVGDMPADPIEELTILFDTSASRALGFGAQVHRLGKLVEQLRADGEFTLKLVAFDQDVSLIYDGPAGGFGTPQLEEIYIRRALGASDLTGALQRVALTGSVSPRVLIVTDGIATAGASEASALRKAVGALGRAGAQRLDALIDGGLQDRDVLTAMTTAGLARDGIVADARLDFDALSSKLRRATLSDVKVSVPGSKWVWPQELDGVQPGDEVLVYADLPESAAMKVVLEGDEVISTDVTLAKVQRPLLERAWVGAQIDALTHKRSEVEPTNHATRKKLKDDIVALSTRHRVLSDFTALLVLETERDYARFNIDRRALSDIMTVGPTGVDVIKRKQTGPIVPDPQPRDAIPQMARKLDPEAALGDAEGGDDGQRHKGEEGKMGRPMPKPSSAGDVDVWGGLNGTEIGEAYGVGGLGLVGTGRGGGGTSEADRAGVTGALLNESGADGDGTIGLGNTGLIGKGGGGGTGSGYGRGAGAGFGGRGKRVPRVRQAKAIVKGPLDKDIIRRIVRAHINEVRHCYNQGLVKDPNLAGRVSIQFTIDSTGRVPVAVVGASTVKDRRVGNCIAKAVKRWKFPKSTGGGNTVVTYPFVLGTGGGTPPPKLTPEEAAAAEAAQRRAQAAAARREQEEAQRRARRAAEEAKTRGSPYEGKMFDVMTVLEKGDHAQALGMALKWRTEAPGDVLALIATGEALEAQGKRRAAARAYGSIIDLFPSRADLRRYAGNRLERLGPAGVSLAVDSYRHAVEQRPDHPSSHRAYAYALLRAGLPEAAFEAIVAGKSRNYPGGRFRGVDRILAEDVGLIGAAWIKADPSRSSWVHGAAGKAGAKVATEPSTRFVMTWETDANDVDFHIYDGKDGHAFYSEKMLSSGGELFADVTNGYGPECFAIEGEPTAFPYRFEANYYSRGPMGYGMGRLQVLQHDGKGGFAFDDRPFVVMKDRAFVPLGELKGPLEPG